METGDFYHRDEKEMRRCGVAGESFHEYIVYLHVQFLNTLHPMHPCYAHPASTVCSIYTQTQPKGTHLTLQQKPNKFK